MGGILVLFQRFLENLAESCDWTWFPIISSQSAPLTLISYSYAFFADKQSRFPSSVENLSIFWDLKPALGWLKLFIQPSMSVSKGFAK